MPRPRVYVETTIPSFYFDERTTPQSVTQRKWTRQWWATFQGQFEFVTGAPVHEELASGPADRHPVWLSLIRDLPVLAVTPAVIEIFRTYVRHKLMPVDERGDGMHLALASYYGCDFLVTWNCKHLANANKLDHIRHINTLLGLALPAILTPRQMLGGDDEEE